ncbi:MAG: hypothetical protein A2Y33_14060 [Spirochaetes bacterium GWF1_51_8]|nr:MAG: hypothetical protein A2Y33_14060 [Spirochaetes bacterium GWF1_51_8]
MKDSFYIDLKAYPVEKYLRVLDGMEMIPSRMILKEDTAARFGLLKNEGIDHLEQLSAALKNPDKISALAKKTGIPEEFLAVLKRELSGFQRPPSLLKEFPGIDPDVIERLEEHGIKNAKQYFEAALTRQDRIALAERYEIGYDTVLDLAKLCGLSRLYGVGPVFARMLVESGTDTTSKVAECDPSALFIKLMKINDEKGYTKAKFRVKDMEFCRVYAGNFPKTDSFEE